MAQRRIILAVRSFAWIVLLLPAVLSAQPAFRVKDLNTTAPLAGSHLRKSKTKSGFHWINEFPYNR